MARRAGKPMMSSQPPKAVRAPFPRFIEPCLPTLRPAAPSGPGWVHEIKFDGYRVQLRRFGATTRCLTRNGYNWTFRFPSIAAAADALPVRELVIDAEAVVLDDNGLPDMVMLRSNLAAGVANGSPAWPLTSSISTASICGRHPCSPASSFSRSCWSGPATPCATANT